MNSNSPKTAWPLWLMGVCVVVLLFSSTVQGIHSCAFSLPNGQGSPHEISSLANGNICSACVMARSASVVLIVTLAFQAFVIGSLIPPVRSGRVSLLSSFDLSVRPPPAL